MFLRTLVALALTAGLAHGAGIVAAQKPDADRPLTAEDRIAILRRSQVWTPLDVSAVDIKKGPDGKGAFVPDETVTCEYVDKKIKGNSPKFTCRLAENDEVKVKFGEGNGEVFGEVAATRLLWALGFGADRMYPVRVVCRSCPDKLGGKKGDAAGVVLFDLAAIERKAPGKTVETHEDEGWSWRELDLVEEAAGGAPVAHRDALKLLAAFIQHGDSKPQQQRLVCLDKDTTGATGTTSTPGTPGTPGTPDEPEIHELCAHPFMMISDLGLTFGRVDRLNRNHLGSVNFERWSQTPIWKKDEACVANLPKSATGSIHDPVIGEAGRKFLSQLMAQLTDQQLHDLFAVAHFDRRGFKASQPVASIDDWVAAFKTKRDQIASRTCPTN